MIAYIIDGLFLLSLAMIVSLIAILFLEGKKRTETNRYIFTKDEINQHKAELDAEIMATENEIIERFGVEYLERLKESTKAAALNAMAKEKMSDEDLRGGMQDMRALIKFHQARRQRPMEKKEE
jgi:hypothetical protein